MGRTARAGSGGKALLLLSENETQLIDVFQERKIKVEETFIDWDKIAKESVQNQVGFIF